MAKMQAKKLLGSRRNFSVDSQASAGDEVVISNPHPVLGEALGGGDPGVSPALLTVHQLGPLEYRRETCNEFLINESGVKTQHFIYFIQPTESSQNKF